jgi:hypothetical protein
VLAPALSVLVANACSNAPVAANGTCSINPGIGSTCGSALDAGSSEALGLVGYSCVGAARPDDSPTYVEGVPEGLLCADNGGGPDGGAGAYCCTADTTACVYDPLVACGSPTYGVQCLGENRPESFNPALTCGQGVYEGDFINYCCSGAPQKPGCVQSDSVVCSPRLIGWTCTGQNLPKGEELGANKSRADLYYFVCPTPTPAANPAYENYCCYVAALPPIGSSCVQDTTVPGCAPGRFGFSCYGPDTPGEDYSPMHCPDPGVPGKSPEGYPATLYCCDFQ